MLVNEAGGKGKGGGGKGKGGGGKGKGGGGKGKGGGKSLEGAEELILAHKPMKPKPIEPHPKPTK